MSRFILFALTLFIVLSSSISEARVAVGGGYHGGWEGNRPQDWNGVQPYDRNRVINNRAEDYGVYGVDARVIQNNNYYNYPDY